MSPNRSPNGLPPEQLKRLFWASQLFSVLLISGLGWWLTESIQVEPIPLAWPALLGVALAAIPAVFILARWLGLLGSRPDVIDHDPLRTATPAPDPRSLLAPYLIVLAVAELPAMLGFVYVFTGGTRWHGLALGAVSLVLLLVLAPNQVRRAGGS